MLVNLNCLTFLFNMRHWLETHHDYLMLTFIAEVRPGWQPKQKYLYKVRPVNSFIKYGFTKRTGTLICRGSGNKYHQIQVLLINLVILKLI